MKLANIVGGVAEASALDRGSSRLLQVLELGEKGGSSTCSPIIECI